MLDMGREPTTGPLGAPALRRLLHSERRGSHPRAGGRAARRPDRGPATDNTGGRVVADPRPPMRCVRRPRPAPWRRWKAASRPSAPSRVLSRSCGRPASPHRGSDARSPAAPVPQAIERRYRDAGMRVDRTTVKGLAKALKAGTPLSIVATAQAADGARTAWEAADPPRPCRLYYLSPDPDPVAVRLDLRPWGETRVALSEEDGAGLAPRADLL